MYVCYEFPRHMAMGLAKSAENTHISKLLYVIRPVYGAFRALMSEPSINKLCQNPLLRVISNTSSRECQFGQVLELAFSSASVIGC